MPQKKKKTQLAPVARGFSTVSVPKKAKPPEDVLIEKPEVAPPLDTVPNVEPTSLPGPIPNSLQQNESLPIIADKIQDKVERDITRTTKSIDTDRRIAQSLPRIECNASLIDRALTLCVDTPNASFKNKEPYEPEEKLVPHLAVTFGVLRRLKFSEARVEECLRAINGVGLEEAYDWLCLNRVEELDASERIEVEGPKSRPGPGFLDPLIYANFCTSFEAFPSSPLPSTTSGSTTRFPLPPSSLNTSRNSPDPGNPTLEYVRIKQRMEDTSREQPDSTEQDVHQWKERLRALQQDFDFDQKEANRMLRENHVRQQGLNLLTKLRGIPLAHEQQQSPARSPTPVENERTDIFDTISETSEDGIFDLLDGVPDTTEELGVVISVRDLPLPKSWTGRNPKSLLKDKVHGIDKYAIISWSILPGVTRFKRASITIRWDTKEANTWWMDGVACADETQAENYISMIVLHNLTFPHSQEFLAPTVVHHPPIQTLPAVFRDIWDELETSRTAIEAADKQKQWTLIRSIAQEKLEISTVDSRQGAKEPKVVAAPVLVPLLSNELDVSLRIFNSFHARQQSASYRSMRVSRNSLPIASYREEIINTLRSSQVLVLSGETGCGKSTQVPAFILEDQLSQGISCKILCTEPRRISAMSLAHRVSRELGDPPNTVGSASSLVGYSIRLENKTSRDTCLKFVTNGIALRMLESGPGSSEFDEITHIIIDEVHERTIESDFLLIVLKTLLAGRPHLKVILMSATLDANKISDYFGGCSTLHVPGRTFPVEVRYLEDAIELTKWSVVEHSPYARRARGQGGRADWAEDAASSEADELENGRKTLVLGKGYRPETANTINSFDERYIAYELIIMLLERICLHDTQYVAYSSAILIFMPGLAEIRRMNDTLENHAVFGEDQNAVFDTLPNGMRKIVIATNIAETGITIPDITCVIDTGKHREMRFDEKRQISRLIETYIAKSNAAQRRGRAGRVQQGLCFHLFTKFRHDKQMADHPAPEMLRLSLSDLALRIKIMKLNLGTTIESVLTSALDPPAPVNIQRAVAALVEVGALTSTEELTPLGRLLSKLPTDVHLGKFLLTATIFRCLDPALTIAAALSSKTPFVTPFGSEAAADKAKASFQAQNSDFLTIHNAFSAWRRQEPRRVFEFCRANFLSHQNLLQIEELRQLFLGYLVESSFIDVDGSFVRELNRARYGRQRHRFVTVPQQYNTNALNFKLVNASLTAGLYPKLLALDPTKDKIQTLFNNQQAAVHPSSINFGRKPSTFGAKYLMFFTLMRSRKLYAWEVAPANDLAILLLCGDCEIKSLTSQAVVDHKIKWMVPSKVAVALKNMRMQITAIIAQRYRGKRLTDIQVLWEDLIWEVLGEEQSTGKGQ